MSNGPRARLPGAPGFLPGTAAGAPHCPGPRPACPRVRYDCAVDALSEVLKALRMTTGIFLDAEFTAPWCIDSAPGKEDVRPILPNVEQVCIFHVVTEGRCSAKLPGPGDALVLARGDMIMFPRGDGHLIGSDVQLAPVPAETLVEAGDGGLPRLAHGGGGERTRFVCGFVACDERLCQPLLGALPRILRIPLGDGAQGAWLIESLQRGAEESRAPAPGTEAVLSKLAELVFVEAIRRHIAGLPDGQVGWLAGVRDPCVGRALAVLHAEPARAWTVDDLAREAATSRSVLAERFSAMVGEPPMQYLARWRLALAAESLGVGQEQVGRIARRVGYESEAAFNRAFKREFGMPPAAWRRAARR